MLTAADSGISYVVEQSDNLLTSNWTNSGWSAVSTNVTVDPDFDEFVHELDGSAKNQLFIRLRITQP